MERRIGLYPDSKKTFLPDRFVKIVGHIKKDRQLLLIFLPCLVFYIIFRYGPLYGILIAFKKYEIYTGIFKSQWVGFKYFIQFFSNSDFLLLFKNTFLLGLYTIVFTFPIPIIFALLLNELKKEWTKKLVQSVSCLPTFISIVIVSSMVIDFLSPSHGIINNIISSLGFEKQYFMINPDWFRTIYIVSDIWNNMGYSAIIYIASISTVNIMLYEAAIIDGCGRFKAMIHITLPEIMPTITVMFIMKIGSMIQLGYEKILLLYNPATYSVADIFATYVYRKGLVDQNYSYASAVGLFESLVSLILLLAANRISRRVQERSLW